MDGLYTYYKSLPDNVILFKICYIFYKNYFGYLMPPFTIDDILSEFDDDEMFAQSLIYGRDVEKLLTSNSKDVDDIFQSLEVNAPKSVMHL